MISTPPKLSVVTLPNLGVSSSKHHGNPDVRGIYYMREEAFNTTSMDGKHCCLRPYRTLVTVYKDVWYAKHLPPVFFFLDLVIFSPVATYMDIKTTCLKMGSL